MFFRPPLPHGPAADDQAAEDVPLVETTGVAHRMNHDMVEALFGVR